MISVVNPHVLPDLVAKHRRCLRMQGARSKDDAGAVRPAPRKPSECNTVDAGRCGVAAENCRDMRVRPEGRVLKSFRGHTLLIAMSFDDEKLVIKSVCPQMP
jgi:hypothetical protein